MITPTNPIDQNCISKFFPGTGKTILAVQILDECPRLEEMVVYIALAETCALAR